MTAYDYNQSHGRVYNLLLWTCLGAALLFVTLVLFNQYKFAFHSDDAVKTVLSRIALSDGSLVSNKWVYANGDLFLISSYIFSVIIYPFFGVSYFSNALSSFISYIFLLFSVYGCCRAIAPDRPRAAIIATALAAGGISAANFEFVIGQGAYSMYAGLTLCLYAIASHPITPDGALKKANILLLTFTAAGLVCISNLTRGDIIIILPILAGWFASMLIQQSSTMRERCVRLLSPSIYAIIAGAILGSLLYKYWLLPTVLNFNAAAKISIASIPEILQHALKLPSAWFEYFQLWGAWQSISILLRLLQCFAWLIAIGFLLTPIWTIFNSKRHPLPLVTLSWITLAGYCVSFAAMVVSTNLFSSSLDIRYATFPVYGSICIIAIVMDGYAMKHPRIGKTLLLALGLVAVLTAAVWRMEHNPEKSDQSDASYTARMALIKALETDNVGTILATYWNSHVLTVLSDGKVDSYPVSIDTTLHPFPHHMPRRIFYGTAGVKQAVVLAGAESSPHAWQAVAYQLGAPYERLTVGPYTVWIYNRNITEAVLETGNEIDFPVPKDLLEVDLSKTVLPPCTSTTKCTATIDVTNLGHHVLASVGFLPLRLGLHGINKKGAVILQDAGRVDFPTVIEPGSTERVTLTWPASPDPRVTAYQICLLQEGVTWLCENTHRSVQ